ncbi:MAG: DNA-processing protein DprA [Halanaerobiales bacterium]
MQNKDKYWLGLCLIKGLGPIRINKLLKYFKDPEIIWNATWEQLNKVLYSGLSQKVIKQRNKIDLNKEMVNIRKKDINFIILNDKKYPEILKQIYDPPPVIFYKGKLDFNQPAVAVIGSRKCTGYGRRVAETISKKLARNGITIVSGMARGIDTCSHQGAIAGNGKTIAVLGSGLDVIYPAENKNLFKKIQNQGVVISEFPPGTKPISGNFPRRNRIISGLSLGTVVVEASTRSGSLITADLALEQGREVFAVPGNISRASSRGTNNLIKKGAKIVTKVSDITEELFLYYDNLERNYSKPNSFPEKISYPELTTPEEKVLKLLQQEESMQVNDIIELTNLKAKEVNTALLKLELKEIIARDEGKKYSFKGLQNLLKPI